MMTTNGNAERSIPTPKFDLMVRTVKVIGSDSIRGGKYNSSRFKKLSPEMRERAVEDAVTKFNTDSCGNTFVSLAKAQSVSKKIRDLIGALDQVQEGPWNEVLKGRCEDLTEILNQSLYDLDEVGSYADLVYTTCTYFYAFLRVLEIKYRRQMCTKEQIDQVRTACDTLGIPYDESRSEVG